MLITIGCIVNIKVGGGVIGALLFSFGLFTILNLQLNLFTGKAGLLYKKKITVEQLCEVYYGNLLGCIATGLLYPESIGADKVCTAQPITALLLAIFCGMLMSIAVIGFKRTGSPLFPIGAVMIFMLSGFQHSIAQMGYLALSNAPIEAWLNLIPISIGNVIGCVVPYALIDTTV